MQLLQITGGHFLQKAETHYTDRQNLQSNHDVWEISGKIAAFVFGGDVPAVNEKKFNHSFYNFIPAPLMLSDCQNSGPSENILLDQ